VVRDMVAAHTSPIAGAGRGGVCIVACVFSAHAGARASHNAHRYDNARTISPREARARGYRAIGARGAEGLGMRFASLKTLSSATVRGTLEIRATRLDGAL
jgi:hypothetical protein